MKTGDIICARTHADFLNKVCGTNYQSGGYMRCTYHLGNDVYIWLIRLNEKQSKEGWTNYDYGNLIVEDYTGNPKTRLEPHKTSVYTHTRAIFKIVERNNERYYVFKGLFKFDLEKGNNDRRVWSKISDSVKI